MKKFLTMGAAALLMGASFTSCSKDKDLYDPVAQAQNFLKNYEAAFVEVFGQPSADQTWGFGTAAKARVTRAVFANGNEWAANDRDDCKYMVPPALTDEQKNVVIKYFQTVQNPAYQDPQWTDYFIQQVYKGGDKPGENSAEKYKAANGSTDIVGSDHMDHLAAINGDFVDHNENFNHGDCSEYGNVLDYKGTLTNVEETYPVNDNEHRHADKINLMLNSTTASFGYYNSNSSVRRTEYTGLVSYQTIINTLGAEANCLNDGWNRSFMGFDFEMMVDDQIFAKELDYSAGWSADIPGGFPVKDYIWFEWNGKKYHMLVAEQNMYCGTPLDITDAQVQEAGFIDNLLAEGYLPVVGGANKKWVKVGGCADGYFSDWIVTLTEAKHYGDVPPIEYLDTPDYRIIAEDLNVGDARSDFDFNDIVFDVYYNQLDATKAKIKVQAAGGTMPLEIRTAGLTAEVHNLFGVATTDMVNTGAGPTVADANKPFFEVTIDKSVADDNIKLYVNNGTAEGPAWNELTAQRGRVASKIKVAHTYQYCSEREDIEVKYPLFKQWVKDPSVKWY